MKLIWRALLIWGIADSLWLAISPRGWSAFWGRLISRLGDDSRLARALAVLEGGLCLALLRQRLREPTVRARR